MAGADASDVAWSIFERPLAESPESISHSARASRTFGLWGSDRESSCQLRDCRVALLPIAQQHAEVGVGIGILSVQGDLFFKLADGFVIPALLPVDAAQ